MNQVIEKASIENRKRRRNTSDEMVVDSVLSRSEFKIKMKIGGRTIGRRGD